MVIGFILDRYWYLNPDINYIFADMYLFCIIFLFSFYGSIFCFLYLGL